MIQYILKRLLDAIPVVIGITLIAFLLGQIMPGDPAEIALSAEGTYQPTKEQIEIQRERMGLNRPLYVQYLDWLKNAIRGDFGKSFQTKHPVIVDIKIRFPNTLRLALISMGVVILIGVPLGILMALFRNSFFDYFNQFLTIFNISVPSFWLAIVLIGIFSETLRILPTSGFTTYKHYIMPVIVLSLSNIGSIARLVRSGILNELTKSYILSARSKGLRESTIIIRHAFKNSIIPIITTLANSFGGILGGSVIIESVFAINGLGKFALDSITYRDYPALQAYVFISGLIFVLVNILVNIFYYIANPNIKLEER